MRQILRKAANILKNRVVKKCLALLIFFGVGSVFLQTNILAPQAVYAQTDGASSSTDNSVTDNKLIQKTKSLNAVLKIVYLLLWPMLALAGLSLDNGMVYGSFFNMDAPLWQFWNIMKNFANFALGFMVLFSIIKSIFAGFDEKGAKAPLEIIKKALVAGILIQASWFVLAAVIDLSTVATYAVGGMPISVLENSDDLGGKPVLGVHSNLNLKDFEDIQETADSFTIWYSYGQAQKISKCEVKEGKYLIGLMNGDKEYDNLQYTSKIKSAGSNMELCVHAGTLYAFDEHPDLKGIDNQKDYATKLGDLWGGDERTSLEGHGDKFDCSGEESMDTLKNEASRPEHGINVRNCYSRLYAKNLADTWLADQKNNYQGMTITSLLEELEGFTGPFVTMYTSMLNFAEISHVPKQGENVGAMWIELLIKTIFALALIVPLALLVVVLLARIGILWLVIAFIPFLILVWTFGWKMDDKNKILSFVSKPGEVIKIIFAPVFIVFALSISLIFMTALNNTLTDEAKMHRFFEEMGSNVDEETGSLGALGNAVNFDMKGNETGGDFDNMLTFASWLITNLFAVALIWTILFGAIKATKLGEGVAGSFGTPEKLLGRALGAIPIMSVNYNGERTGVGLGAISEGLQAKATQLSSPAADSTEVEAIKKALGMGQESTTAGPSVQDAVMYQQLKNLYGSNLNDTILAAAGVTSSASAIEGSTAYQNLNTSLTTNAATISDLNTQSAAGEGKINPLDVKKMSKTDVVNAMNSGKLDLAEDTGVSTNDGKHYTVVQTPAAFGGYIFDLMPVDDGGASDAQKAAIKARQDAMFEEQKKLHQENKDIITQLRAQNASAFGDKHDAFDAPTVPETPAE